MRESAAETARNTPFPYAGVMNRPLIGYARVWTSEQGPALQLDALKAAGCVLALVEDLERQGAGFRSPTEAIDTTTAGGKLVFSIFCDLAEFERRLLRERTRAGLAPAGARGRNGGRPTGMTEARIELARSLREQGRSHREIGEALRIGASTVRDHLAKVG